jgi:hypothetical protein
MVLLALLSIYLSPANISYQLMILYAIYAMFWITIIFDPTPGIFYDNFIVAYITVLCG